MIKDEQKIAFSHSNADFIDNYNDRGSTIYSGGSNCYREEVSEIDLKFGVNKSIIYKLIKSYNKDGIEEIGVNLSNKILDLK